MRILHVTPHYYPAWAYGGSARVPYEICRELAGRGHEVTVFTTDALDSDRRVEVAPGPIQIDGVQVYYFRNLSNSLKWKFNLSSPRGLRRAAKRSLCRFDVIHVHEFRTVENLIVLPLAHRAGVGTVLSPHGTLPYGTGRGGVKQMWDRIFGRRLMKLVDVVIALTEDEAADVHALWGRYKRHPVVDVIPNGVRAEDFIEIPSGELFRAEHELGRDPVVMFLGRLHRRKGVDVLIKAFARAAGGVPNAKLVIVGPDEGALPAAKALVREIGLGRKVVFVGFLAGEEKLEALGAADVFVLPAIGEGLPIAALEAGAAGLPLVLSPGCHLPEVERVGAGVIVEPEPEPLGDAIAGLLADPDKRARMGAAAREWVLSSYTWAAVVDRLERIYDKISRVHKG